MWLDLPFRGSVLGLYLGLLVMWIVFQARAGAYRDGLRQHGRAQRAHETGRLVLLRPLLGLPEHVGILVWLAMPAWMQLSSLPLPPWLRWSGAGLGLLALLVLGWSMYALGPNFVATLGLQAQHTLVDHGPYRFVRHPMYLALLTLQVAIGLLTANWLIGVTGVGLIVAVIAERVPREERQLHARLGAAYQRYSQRTGRLWPRRAAFHRVRRGA